MAAPKSPREPRGRALAVRGATLPAESYRSHSGSRVHSNLARGNVLPDVLRDPGGHVKSDTFRGTSFKLELSSSVLPLAQVDGEEADPAPRVTLEVEKRALRLVVPKPHASGY